MEDNQPNFVAFVIFQKNFYIGEILIYLFTSKRFIMKNKTTAGIMGILLGGIGYLTMDDYDFDVKYNREHVELREPVRYGSNGSSRDVSKELEKLHELKEKGVITEDEFLDRKENLIYG